MTIPRETLDPARRGKHSLICRGRNRHAKKCYACSGTATLLCDHPRELPAEVTAADLEALGELALEMTTCSRHCCPRHACWWHGKQHLCREHAEQLGVWA